MKIFTSFILAISIVAISCNNHSASTKEASSEMNGNKEITSTDSTDAKVDIKIVTVTYNNVDAGITVYLKGMIQNYLAVKNALVNGDAKRAAAISKNMNQAHIQLDKSLFTADQKKIYDAIEDGSNAHWEQIGENGDNIKLQREHFSHLSNDMYDMVKAFGAGTILYHDHCPMYNDNQGAMWLSETKEIRNPYFGDQMMTCGSVEEMFK